MAAAYKLRSKVVPYPGMGGWFFLYVDKKQAAVIREKHAHVKKGFGSIRVRATIGKTTWDTSIFPDKRSGTYVLPLKAAVRRAEGLDGGDAVTFVLAIA